MKNYQNIIVKYVFKLLVWMIVYTILRFVFVLLYFPEQLSSGSFLNQIVGGWHFDIATLLYFNVIFIPLTVFLFKKRWLNILMVLINTLPLALCFMDLVYYQYSGQRTTTQVLELSNDINNLLVDYTIDFGWLLVPFSILLLLVFNLLERIDNWVPTERKEWFPSLVLTITLFGLSFIGLRGGIGLRPIGPMTAFNYSDSQHIDIVTNSPFVFLFSFGQEGLVPKKYFSTERMNEYLPLKEGKVLADSMKKKNVVLIVIESLSKEFLTPELTPFLDSLKDHSIYFPNAYANSKTSIKGIHSILTGTPSLMDRPLMHSTYSKVNVPSVGHALRKNGITSHFYHGAKNGSMSFDVLCNKIGIEHYYGLDQYEGTEGLGAWGVHDHAFLKEVSEQIKLMENGQFITLFSLSSHHPFELPEGYQDKYKEGGLPIYKTLQYTDHSLREFMNDLKTWKGYNNSLFIITADHSSSGVMKEYKTMEGSYRIPIMIFDPVATLSFGEIDSTVVQQIDVLPTIYDVLIDAEIKWIGNNLLDTSKDGMAIQHRSGLYQYINDTSLIRFNGKQSTDYFDKNLSEVVDCKEVDSINFLDQENSLKAIIQFYDSNTVNNTWLP